jgi:hypothetical protein
MKINIAKVTGLALLAASFAFSSSLVYADPEDTTSAPQVIALDAGATDSQTVAVLDCDTDDGVGACPVEATLYADASQPASAAVETAAAEPSAMAPSEAPVAVAAETPATEEPAAAMNVVDAIIAEVHATVIVAAPGEDASLPEQPTGTIAEPPAADPVLAADDQTTNGASAAPANEGTASQAAAAIVVEVTQTVTVAAPGQEVANDEPAQAGSVVAAASQEASDEEPAHTGSIAETAATAPVSMLDGKSCDDQDF